MIIHDVTQGTAEWLTLRAGIPTASNFSMLVTSTGERSKSLAGYALTLAGEMFAGKPLEVWDGNQWTDRGKELEAEAIRLYEFANDTEVKRVGFVTDNDKSHGCSPDGFVGQDGMVEIKCLKPENHIKAILYFQAKGSCPTDYIQQTQGQLLIAERQWCDLIFYHPALPLLTIRQTPNVAIHAALVDGLVTVKLERDRIVDALRRQANPTQQQKEAA